VVVDATLFVVGVIVDGNVVESGDVGGVGTAVGGAGVGADVDAGHTSGYCVHVVGEHHLLLLAMHPARLFSYEQQ
jgi:hypothetical protein